MTVIEHAVSGGRARDHRRRALGQIVFDDERRRGLIGETSGNEPSRRERFVERTVERHLNRHIPIRGAARA